MTIEHNDQIDWPNGQGYTPCSEEYANKLFEKNLIHKVGEGSLDDLSPADYQRYCELDNELGNMQLNGHLGKSVRY